MQHAGLLQAAYKVMATAKTLSDTFEANRQKCKYVHATSRGHEAIQVATGLQLLPCDYVSPYYRDDAMLLAIGYSPYQLMLQLLAKADDPFSGGRAYYCHPSNNLQEKPLIIHQSSATGMQAIPTAGIAQGIQYLEKIQSTRLNKGPNNEAPVVICSLGDNSMTEGEVAEALQFSVLKQLPIIFLVQDNDWGISVSASEARAMNAFEYALGFKGLKRMQCDGTDFALSYATIQQAIQYVRTDRKPVLVHARVVLLSHHTSGVRKEFYRSTEDLNLHNQHDPVAKLRQQLIAAGITQHQLREAETLIDHEVKEAFKQAEAAPEPSAQHLNQHVFAQTTITTEAGVRAPAGAQKVLMVDAALHAIEEIMQQHPETILYGQDVGRRLGGVFREAATLAEKFGDHRVFNTAIQEAYIVGSANGLAAVGVKPIVQIQFADYLFPGFNQLVCEIAKSCYLTNGKFPVQMLLRVPTGAYGGGGPYHSASVESTLLTIKGIKICYPSNAADMKGLMKAAFADPNPVIMLEHKGLYWSKVPGTEAAKTMEPAADYIVPLGKAAIVVQATDQHVQTGNSVCIITYGMGVYWSMPAAAAFAGMVEVIDLRTLFPLDEDLVYAAVCRHGKCIIVSEAPTQNSFAEALAGRISKNCFAYLDAPVEVIGAADLPAIPLNTQLEAAALPNAQVIQQKIAALLQF